MTKVLTEENDAIACATCTLPEDTDCGSCAVKPDSIGGHRLEIETVALHEDCEPDH